MCKEVWCVCLYGSVLSSQRHLMLNSDGFAVSFGKGNGHSGDMHRPPSQTYYCGRKLDQCRCGHCDGRCGPTNGCPCNSCKELTLSGVPHDDEYIKCPLGHRMTLSERSSSWNCDSENCTVSRRTSRPRWRCVEESCDFDYCGACYSARLSTLVASKTVRNYEGAKATKSFDYIHTGSERHYCGRFVGMDRYANDCQLCSGKCGPSAGCQCRACFLLDDPKFLSNAALHSSGRLERNKPSHSHKNSDVNESNLITYSNGDSYIGESVNGQRHGEGIYRLSLKNPSRYLEYPGVWEQNQLLQYMSYQNVWWKCSDIPDLDLTPLPSNASGRTFDVNLLLSAEYLFLGNYFLVKLGPKVIFLQNYIPPAVPWFSPTRTEVEVNGVWLEQNLSFTIRFSLDFRRIESGNIVHLPSNTLVYKFLNQVSVYRPELVDHRLFQQV